MTHEHMTHEKTRSRTRNYTNAISCLFVFFFVWFSVFNQAVAQEATGVRIQPSLIEERVDPGQIFSSILHITNLDSETRTFYIVKRNISGLTESGTPIFAAEEEETGYEISSWIKVAQDSITIPGKQTKEVPFSIEVPVKASPGGHFGGIFVSFTPPRPKETGIAVGFEVGTIINLRISGEVQEEAQIREFRTDRTIYSKPEVKFMTRVENLGNVLVRPRGPLEITDFFGKKVATLRINNEAAGIFPKTIRSFETSWQGGGLTFGRYQVVMGLVYGEEGRKTISDTLSFWVLPLNIILPVVGGALGLLLAIVVLIKLYIRRRLRQIQEMTPSSVGTPAREADDKISRLYQQRKSAFSSKLIFITALLLVAILIFLIILFFFFA